MTESLVHHIFFGAAAVVLVSSLLSSFLPPWETFSDFPRFQKFYKVLIVIVYRWGQLNLRTTIYPQLKNGSMDVAAPSPPPEGGKS